ncbi:MAG TPA: MFS transporter [Victivallales bacterium]|nr:MFS transporter [Victivallales bacterium]
MIVSSVLSYKQQAKERKKLLFFSFFNGVSHICVSGNIIILFLLQAGLSPALVTGATSFVYIGSFAVIFSSFLIAGWGAAKTISISGQLKGIAAVLLALTPFFINYLSPIYITLLLLAFSLLFYVFRYLGSPAMRPLLGDLTESDNKGKFTSSSFLYYNLAMLACLIGLFFYFKLGQTLGSFEIVITFGAVISFLCSFIMVTVKESEMARKTAKDFNIFSSLKKLKEDSAIRNFFIARGFSVAISTLVISVSVIALKRIYNISDTYIFIYIIIQLLGSIGVTYISGIISEYTGPKPLMIIYVIGNMFIALIWIFIPDHINIYSLSAVFLIGGITGSGLTTSSFHYFLILVPEKKSVGYSLIFSLYTGVIGGVASIVIGGGLIKILTMLISSEFMVFKIFFLIMLIISLPVIYLLSRLTTCCDVKVKNVVGLLLSPREMFTLYSINKFEKYSSLKTELENISFLQNKKTRFSKKSLLYYLESPYSLVRTKALRGLNSQKLTCKEDIEALIRELEQGEYSTGYMAAYILGNNNIKEAIPYLRKALDTEDYSLKSQAMISLSQQRDIESRIKIKNIFMNSDIPKVLLAGSISLSIFEDDELPKLILAKAMSVECPTIIKLEMFYYITKYYGVQDEYYKFIRLFKVDKEQGILWILGLLKDLNEPYKLVKDCFYEADNRNEIASFFNIEYSSCECSINSFTDIIRNINIADCCDDIIYMFFIISSKCKHRIR